MLMCKVRSGSISAILISIILSLLILSSSAWYSAKRPSFNQTLQSLVAVLKLGLSDVFVVCVVCQQVKLGWMCACLWCRGVVVLLVGVGCLVVVLHSFVEAVHPEALVALAFWFGEGLLILHEWRHVWVEETWMWRWTTMATMLLAMLLTIAEGRWHHAEWEWEEAHWIWWEAIGLACLARAVVLEAAVAFADWRFLHWLRDAAVWLLLYLFGILIWCSCLLLCGSTLLVNYDIVSNIVDIVGSISTLKRRHSHHAAVLCTKWRWTYRRHFINLLLRWRISLSQVLLRRKICSLLSTGHVECWDSGHVLAAHLRLGVGLRRRLAWWQYPLLLEVDLIQRSLVLFVFGWELRFHSCTWTYNVRLFVMSLAWEVSCVLLPLEFESLLQLYPCTAFACICCSLLLEKKFGHPLFAEHLLFLLFGSLCILLHLIVYL